MHFSKKELKENHERLKARDKLYAQHGLDHDAATAFVLEKALPLEGRVLEIGTGKGRFLVELLKHTLRVTTLDISADEQRFARMNVAFARPPGKARFVVGDAARLPWRSGAFDAVVSVNALHHIRELARAIEEMSRVVRRSGKLILADFDEEYMARLDAEQKSEGRIHQRHAYTLEDVAEQLTHLSWAVKLEHGAGQGVVVAQR